MSFNRSSRSQSLNQPPPLAEKLTEEPVTSRTAQSTVTCVYMANIASHWRRVTVTWCKNLMSHFFTITVHGLDGAAVSDGGVAVGGSSFCKIDLKPWHFWTKKGYKSFDLDSAATVEVFWDIRAAKFSGGRPEPCSDFYVALVCDEEVVLMIGDIKKKAYKRTKCRPALADAVLFCKKENVFGKRCFTTRARFDERRSKDCDIVVETTSSTSFGPGIGSGSGAGARDPEMWISVDGLVVVHVKNLQWKFRGNQTVVVNNQTVQVFWDVHDWMFGGVGVGGGGRGLFVFKPGAAAAAGEGAESEKEGSVGHGSDGGSVYYTAGSAAAGAAAIGNDEQFCLFLTAWKID